MRACWLFRGIGPSFPMDVSPFSGGWEFIFQKMVTFYRGMGTSLPVVTPLPRDRIPFPTGGEALFRAKGASLPKDGSSVSEEWKTFCREMGTHFPRAVKPPTAGWEPLYRETGTPSPSDGKHFFRIMGIHLPKDGNPFSERQGHLRLGMGTPFSE